MNKDLLIGLAVILAFGLGWGFANWDGVVPERPVTEVAGETEWATFSHPLLGLVFDYPKTYMLKERPLTNNGYEVVLVKDTAENRAVWNGESLGREGPISINVQSFPNPENLSPLAWANQNNISNISLAVGEIQEFQVAGWPAILYQWDGLYRADQIIFAAENKIFSLSSTYLEAEDEIRIVFVSLITSLRVLQSELVNTPPTDEVCIQVITPAQNPVTGEVKEFGTPCAVPVGWEVIR
jgi:hypothetical protein